MALLLEVLQKSDKTYAIDRGFYCFFQNMNNRKLNQVSLKSPSKLLKTSNLAKFSCIFYKK